MKFQFITGRQRKLAVQSNICREDMHVGDDKDEDIPLPTVYNIKKLEIGTPEVDISAKQTDEIRNIEKHISANQIDIDYLTDYYQGGEKFTEPVTKPSKSLNRKAINRKIIMQSNLMICPDNMHVQYDKYDDIPLATVYIKKLEIGNPEVKTISAQQPPKIGNPEIHISAKQMDIDYLIDYYQVGEKLTKPKSKSYNKGGEKVTELLRKPSYKSSSRGGEKFTEPLTKSTNEKVLFFKGKPIQKILCDLPAIIHFDGLDFDSTLNSIMDNLASQRFNVDSSVLSNDI